MLFKLESFTLKDLLNKINPYLQAVTASNLNVVLQRSLEAHILSSQESVFGKCLENIANVAGGCLKSSTTGVDLDFKRKHRILMAIKSGENWSNSSSSRSQSLALKQAKRIVLQNDHNSIITMVGCCYGKRKTSNKSKLADITISGQNLWYLMSGEKDFYKEIIHEMAEGAEEFEKKLNKLHKEIYDRLLEEIKLLCPDGSNIWDILVERCCKNYSDDDKLLHHIME